MLGLIRSIRRSTRTLLKAPAFTWAAVLLLALGIGMGTAAFTIVDHVMLRALPYPESDRLVYMTNGAHSGPTMRQLDGVTAFSEWSAASSFDMNLTQTGSDPVRLRAVEVSSSFFSMFGVRPAIGRLLTEADGENPRGVVLISHGAWERIWGLDPSVVGSSIQLDGAPVEVVGVLSEDFVSPRAMTGSNRDLIFPLDWTNPGLENPGYHAHSVVGRLGPGATVENADQQLDQIAADLAVTYPDSYEGEMGEWPLIPLAEQTVGQEASRGLGLLLGAVGLLLLVACSNVAHLFLARGIGRTQEMAVRRALGASTRQLLTQLTIESAVIGALGGVLGLGLAWSLLRGFARWTTQLPSASAISLDLRVLAFATLLSAATVVLFGLLPALRSIRSGLHDQLRSGSRGASSGRSVRLFRSGLVVGEVGVSLVLVALAGLLVRSFNEVARQDTGFEPENVWMVPLTLPDMETGEEYVQVMSALADEVERVPGVQSATWSGELPFENVGGSSCCWATRFQPPEGAEPFRLAGHSVDEDFFSTFGTELVQGTGWVRGETEPVAIVGERLAVRLWGSAEAALGETISLRGADRRIVGVAEHTLHYGLDQVHDNTAYIPAWQGAFSLPWGSIALRLEPGAEPNVQASVREAIWRVSPDLPITDIRPFESWIDESTSARRFGGTLSTAFGVIALLLAAGGLYGTLLYSVGEQRRAIGIRLALGAGRARIQRSIVQKAIALGGLGVVVGVTATWYLTRFIEGFLFGVEGRDAGTLALAAVVLLATAATAAWVPARRASGTDPLETLRAE